MCQQLSDSDRRSHTEQEKKSNKTTKQEQLCERWIIQHDTSVGQRKYQSPWQVSNPCPPATVGDLSTELRELMECKFT